MAKQTAPKVEEMEVENPVMLKGMPDFDKWTDEQIGFAPYWKPQEGKWFYGAPVAVDMRDPKFVRYQFLAGADIPCQRGPGDEDSDRHEKVTVKEGQRFSLSVYYSLRDAFDEYLQFSSETGKPVFVRVDAVRTVPTSNHKTVWEFRVRVEPTIGKQLAAWRMANPSKQLAGAERPQLES